MDLVFAESISRPKFLAQILEAFAGLALLLAAIGTYGMLSCMVTERRNEIGIRLALGASRSDVIAQIMKQGFQVTALGVAIGLAGALAVNRVIASLLFGVQADESSNDRLSGCDDGSRGGGRQLAACVASIAVRSECGAQR